MRYQKRSVNDSHLIKAAAFGDLPEIEQEIKSGACELFSLGACHFVVRCENTSRGKELVIVCAQGQNLIKPIAKIIQDAISQQFDCIRFHPATKRRGAALLKMASQQGKWLENQYYIVNLKGV